MPNGIVGADVRRMSLEHDMAVLVKFTTGASTILRSA
jgi:hypothetical protein